MSEVAQVPVNVQVLDEFLVQDSDGNAITGIAAGAFTTALTLDGASSAQAVTIAEDAAGGGGYKATFTPNATGRWKLLITHATYGKWRGHYRATNRDIDDLAFPATSGRSLAVDTAGNVQTLESVAKIIRTGTCQAGATSTSIVLDAGASATNSIYKNCIVVITGGTGLGQAARLLTSYTGASKTGQVQPAWTTTPDATTTFMLIATPGAIDLGMWMGGTPFGLSGNLVQTNVNTWANTNVNPLTAAGNVQADVEQWRASTPNALLSGRVDSDLGAVLVRANTAQAGSTASTIKLDAGASATDNLYQYGIVVTTGGTGAGQVRPIASYVGSTKVATIAPNWTTTPDATTTFVVYALPGAVLADTRFWNGTAPNNLISGRVDASIGAIASGVIAAGSFAANALGAVWDELTASHTTANTFGKLLGTFTFSGSNVQANVNGVTAGAITSAAFASGALATDVWGAARSSYNAAGTFGQIGQMIVRDGTAQAGAGSTVTLDAGASATTDFYRRSLILIYSGTGAGQSRFCTAYNGTTKVATVSPAWSTNPDATSKFVVFSDSIPGVDWSNIENPGSSVSLNSTLIASVLGDVNGRVVGSSATAFAGVGVQADVEQWRGSVPNALQTGRVDSYVGALAAAVIAASNFAANAVDSNAFAQAAADKVWSTAVRALTDKANFTLSAAGVQAIWDALTANLTTVGSIGKLLVTDIDATISSRLASASYTAPPSVASIAAAILATPANLLVTDASGRVTVGAMAASVIDTATVTAGYLSSVAQQTLKEALSGVEGTASRYSLAGAIAKLVNKVTLTPSTLTVYKTDGVTTNYTQTVVEDPNANPVSSVS